MLTIVHGDALAAGLLLGAASVLSLGPNSLMMIREGLSNGRVGLMATLVLSSYLSLLGMALIAAGTLNTDSPSLRTLLSWFGLTALLWFSASAFRAALNASKASNAGRLQQESKQACAVRALKVVWANPLTYIELFLVPSALCGTFKEPTLRADFICGLIVMAAARCYGYSYGGRLCASLLRHPKTVQFFDLSSGLLLLSVAVSMVIRLCF